MSRDNLDLKLVSLVAVAGLLAGLAIDEPAIRLLPAVFLVLVAPGYALSVVLFPEPREHAERWLLAIGASLSLDVLTGLVLDRTGLGLTARSWSITLAVLTLALVAGAWQSRADTTAEPYSLEGGLTVPSLRGRAGILLAGGAVLALVIGAVLIARLPASSAHVRGFTLLWALPRKTAASTFGFRVGVRSDELRTTSYTLMGRTGGRVVFRRTLMLKPGRSWTARGSVGQSSPGFGFVEVVRFSLYRVGDLKAPYRQVFLSPAGP